ncbi:hypothetical protein A1OO_15030 [Enterovibrio norvegicus FF-33]|uniref:Uncharacterized protein n=1 Tax=Enterovibrio norvegicus FF-454 TaxID=1185651 RepID=A0A1E5C3D0_9GAMM|nr:hypothetical protein [Enterovibrio norvegicus]OEE60001.1 hypothetical protein A1OK_12590 [Enterovibrio norvegicus FF-454]OEE67071.1 hypothetical protein A1OO_15030 [Enterovibrio norvegicus FF-33]OEE79460.1 hypothetical protein A1OQ_04840 [Enterovibrio norvegicus FF-162]
MKVQNYLKSYDDFFEAIDTQLVDGMYVIERRRPRERRDNRVRFQGYDRRNSADRRDTIIIDEYI